MQAPVPKFGAPPPSPPAWETGAGGHGEFGSLRNKRAEGASGERNCPPQESLLPCVSAFNDPFSATFEALRIFLLLVPRMPAPRLGPRRVDPQNSGDTGAGRASRDARALIRDPSAESAQNFGPGAPGWASGLPQGERAFSQLRSWGP